MASGGGFRKQIRYTYICIPMYVYVDYGLDLKLMRTEHERMRFDD